jgi:hypothetical protein
MATKPATKTAAAKPNTAVAVKKDTPVSTEVMDFSSDSGRGMEGATTESFAIPFLAVLQKGSPQVDEDSGVAIEGAKAGMLFNTVTQELMDGRDEGVTIVPCAYRRVFLRWGARDGESSGFKGEFSPEEVAQMRNDGKIVEQEGRLYVPLPDGSVNEKKCDRFADTRNHYILLLDEDGGAQQALLSLTSTQVKKSKGLMSALANVRLPGANGKYTPPTFANVVRVKTVPESNDKGSWSGVTFAIEGQVQSKDVYEMAKAFNASVAKGTVTANYDENAVGGSGGEARGPADGF